MKAQFLILMGLGLLLSPSKALAFPHQQYTIGHSTEQRPIVTDIVGNPQAPHKVLLIFGQHGDEGDSIATGKALLNDFKNHSHDRLWQKRLSHTQLVILTVMNPDGAFQKRRKNSRGVDLNRNWGFHWDAFLPSTLAQQALNPEGENYRGAMAFSEPETRALKDWARKQKGLKAVLDYHTGENKFAQGMVLYPFNHSAEDELPLRDTLVLKPLAENIAKTLSSSEKTPYKALQAHKMPGFIASTVLPHFPEKHHVQIRKQLPTATLSPGSSIDWFYGERQVPAFGIEAFRPFPLKELNTPHFQKYLKTQVQRLKEAVGVMVDQAR